jgi:hypothetical protein
MFGFQKRIVLYDGGFGSSGLAESGAFVNYFSKQLILVGSSIVSRLLILSCVLTLSMSGQAKSRDSEMAAIEKTESTIQTLTVNLSPGKPLSMLPAMTARDSPVRCSLSGTTFFDIYADSTSTVVADFPQLYSVDHLGDVKHLQRKLPADYKSFMVLSTFPSSDALYSLIQASQKIDSFDPHAAKTIDYFIVVSGYDGSARDVVRVDLNFSPTRIGVLDSGRIVVLGIDEPNHVPALAILSPDGKLYKSLDLNNRSYEKDGTLNQIFNSPKDPVNKDQSFAVIRASSFAEFVGDGPNLILVQGDTKLPVRVIGDEGEIREFTLTYPSGFVIHDLLASDPDGPIVARLQIAAEVSKQMQGGSASQTNETLAEFSRQTGKILKWIRVLGGPYPQDVTCATNGELTAIYWPPDDPKSAADAPATDKSTKAKVSAVDQLLFAKAPL